MNGAHNPSYGDCSYDVNTHGITVVLEEHLVWCVYGFIRVRLGILIYLKDSLAGIYLTI